MNQFNIQEYQEEQTYGKAIIRYKDIGSRTLHNTTDDVSVWNHHVTQSVMRMLDSVGMTHTLQTLRAMPRFDELITNTVFATSTIIMGWMIDEEIR